MRSRASQARALFRVISAQSSSSASTATATASASTSTSSTTPPATARSTRPSIPSTRRRRQISAAHAAASIASSSSSTSPFRSRSQIDNKSDKSHRTIFINTSSSKESQSAGQSVISGLQPVQPPRTSLSSVATQAFFALDRPLLEHVVTSETSKRSALNSFLQATSDESEAAEDMKTSLESASEAMREVASHASRLSADELSRTTFVISRSAEDNEGFAEQAPAKRVASIDFKRFSKLVDNLSKTGSGIDAVEREADALEKEAAVRRDIESAVANALERGEDATAAKTLGSEAELVVLGEPKGPNPEWPRGVATFLAERTRALEAPAPPAAKDVRAEGQAQSAERLEIEDLVKHFGSGFSVQNVNEDDPTLLLSHAMVQAILPSKLRWDGIVAKMNAAVEPKSSLVAKAIDVNALNADLLPQAEETSEGDQVHMDSVKRKRRKKMRKHKYRKFRKATRTERNRLKK